MSRWSKSHLGSITDNSIYYNIHPHELTGSYLEYLFQNDKVNVDDLGNMFLKDNNILISTGDTDLDTRAGSHKIVKVKHLPTHKSNITDYVLTQELLIYNNNDTKLTTMTSNGKYIKNIFNVAKLKLIRDINKYFINPATTFAVNVDDFKDYPSGDIHFIRDNQLHIKPLTIMEMIGDDVILIGYPDPHKMSYHMPYIQHDALKQIYKRQELENADTLRDIYSNANLPDKMDVFEQLYDKNTIVKLRTFIEEEKEKDIISKHLFNQILMRIKYVFLLGKIINGEIVPLLNTVYDINETHTNILKQVDNVINERLYKIVAPESSIRPNVLNYVRYTGFFHIESEYINPMSNFKTFNYTIYNLMTLDEIIYNSAIPGFYQKNTTEFHINDQKLSDAKSQTGGGKINFISNKYKVILFHITNLKEIEAIVLSDKFYYVKIIPTMNIDKIQAVKDFYVNNKEKGMVVYSSGKDEYIALHVPDMSFHQITIFEEMVDFVKYRHLLVNNPLATIDYVNDVRFTKNDIVFPDGVKIENPNKYLHPLLRDIVILYHDIRNVQLQEKYKAINVKTMNRFDSGKYTIIYYKKNEKFEKYIGWILPINLVNMIVSDYRNKIQRKYEIPDDFIYDVSGINSETADDVMRLWNKYVSKCVRERDKYDIYCHEFGSYENAGLHLKIEVKDPYNFNVDQDSNISWFMRVIFYDRIVANLGITRDYYKYKPIHNISVVKPKYILYNYISSQMGSQMNTKLIGGASGTVMRNLLSLEEYKEITELINPKFNKFDINNILLGEKGDSKDSKLKELIANLHKSLSAKYEYGRMSNVFLFPLLDKLYNDPAESLLIVEGKALLTYFDENSDHKFDLVTCKSSYTSQKVETKNINEIFGNDNKDKYELVPELMDKLENKYDNAIIIQPSLFANASSSFILSSIMFQQNMYNVVIALNSLRNNGKLGFYLKLGMVLPATQKLLNVLGFVFKNVSVIPISNHGCLINCQAFDRKKYIEIKDDLVTIVREMPVARKSDIKDQFELFKESNNSRKSRKSSHTKSKSSQSKKASQTKEQTKSKTDIEIVYDIDLDIKPNRNSKLAISNVQNMYLDYLNQMDYLTETYNDEELLYKLLNEYLVAFVETCERYDVNYNKYYLSLIKDYHEEIYTKMLSIDENIDSTLVLYKDDGLVEDFLSKIKNCKPYKYDVFNDVIKKLGKVKNIRKGLIEKYTDKPLRDIVRISEDFTRGISQYLYKRYNLDIVPSNAFTKLWEIYVKYNLVPNKKVVKMFHLAEAPGQFIKATEYFISKNMKNNEQYAWKANSLNPFNKVVTDKYGTALFRDDYGLIKKNRKDWIWGADNTGDITSSDNIRWYREYLHNWANKDPIDVVTGDGGLENDTDLVNLQKLDYAQFLLCVATCSIGKHCIIKTFTPFLGSKPETLDSSGFYVGLCFLYKLLFREVHLCKPYTSRPTSGEYYVVGKGFMGISDKTLDKLLDIMDNFKENQCFFEKNVIPHSFVLQIHNFIDNISNHNVATIERQNFFFTCKIDDSEIGRLNKCKEYLDTKKMESIHNDRYKVWTDLFKFK